MVKVVLVIILVSAIIIWLIYQVYINIDENNPFDPFITPPNSSIQEISWDGQPYTIYYEQTDNTQGSYTGKLYSILSNGKNKKLLYSAPEDIDGYFLLHSQNKIIVMGFKEVTVLDKEGQIEKTYPFPENRQLSSQFYSLNNQQDTMIIETNSTQEPRTVVYTLDLLSGKYEKSNLKASFDERYIETYKNTQISNDGKHTAKVLKGTLYIDNKEFIHSAGRKIGFKFTSIAGCYPQLWFPDNNHLLTQCDADPIQFRIVEVSTGKNAVLDQGIVFYPSIF